MSSGEERELAWALRGIVGARAPLWASILSAANGDPLRAMEIEERVSEEWWARWQAYSRAQAAAAKGER